MNLTFESVVSSAEQAVKENAINGLNVLLGNVAKPAPVPSANPTPSTAGPGNQNTGPASEGAGGAGFPSNTGAIDFKTVAVYSVIGIAAIAAILFIARR